jgi:hypothetical protein
MPRSKIKPLPSLEELLALLDYDPVAGSLIWKLRLATSKANKGFNASHAGKPAGSCTIGRKHGDNKYLVVGIRNERGYHQYQAHRIIWKMMTGDEPSELIDHIDRDPFNLKWENFREATNGTNIQNSKLRRDNISGVKGVSWDAQHKKWRVTISVNKQHFRLGRFSTVEEAKSIIELKRQELHGEFARLK